MNRVVTGFGVGSGSVKRQTAVTKLDFLKTKMVMKLLILGVFVVLLSIFYIWSRVQIVQIGYQINELQKDNRVLVDEHKKLLMELSLMESPEKIKARMMKNGYMSYPEAGQIKTANVKKDQAVQHD